MERFFNLESAKENRRALRKSMPSAEVILWQSIRREQLGGFKFRRQYSVGSYVIDFFCAEAKLAIEVDGESHYVEGAKEKDDRRQQIIEGFGIRFLRFTNPDVYDNLDGVLETIYSTLKEIVGRREPSQPLPTSPSKGEESEGGSPPF